MKPSAQRPDNPRPFCCWVRMPLAPTGCRIRLRSRIRDGTVKSRRPRGAAPSSGLALSNGHPGDPVDVYRFRQAPTGKPAADNRGAGNIQAVARSTRAAVDRRRRAAGRPMDPSHGSRTSLGSHPANRHSTRHASRRSRGLRATEPWPAAPSRQAEQRYRRSVRRILFISAPPLSWTATVFGKPTHRPHLRSVCDYPRPRRKGVTLAESLKAGNGPAVRALPR